MSCPYVEFKLITFPHPPPSPPPPPSPEEWRLTHSSDLVLVCRLESRSLRRACLPRPVRASPWPLPRGRLHARQGQGVVHPVVLADVREDKVPLHVALAVAAAGCDVGSHGPQMLAAVRCGYPLGRMMLWRAVSCGPGPSGLQLLLNGEAMVPNYVGRARLVRRFTREIILRGVSRGESQDVSIDRSATLGRRLLVFPQKVLLCSVVAPVVLRGAKDGRGEAHQVGVRKEIDEDAFAPMP